MIIFLFITSLIITIIVHELGHLFAALYLKVKVEYFQLGFWKPYIEFKIKNIPIRISPWLLGGCVKVEGEESNTKTGILALPYRQKLIIILAGVAVNLVVALLIYLFLYQSIYKGLCIDFTLMKSSLLKDDSIISNLFIQYPDLARSFVDGSLIWIYLSFMNIMAFVTNIFPFPALDGSLVCLVWLEKLFDTDTYVKVLNRILKIGFYILIVVQIILIGWYYLC